MEAVPVALGPQPALYLAIENLSPQLLNRHGLFFELGPGTFAVQHALCHEPWWIFNEDGELSGSGLLRPHRGNAGVYQLRFQTASTRGASSYFRRCTPMHRFAAAFLASLSRSCRAS